MAGFGDRLEMMIKSTFDSKGFDEAEKRTKKLKDEAKDASKSGKDLGNAFSSGFKTAAVGLMAKGISMLATQIPKLTKQSADYIETLNVLQVAFDGNSDSIRKFTSNIADTLNLDDATLIKTAASFKTLANSMGYASELGSKFSKMMTQLSTDVASLYNTDIKDAASMIQYAVQGQGKTLKAKTGASVNETTVQLVLDTIGVDATVTKMNDYEKALARTIAITYEMQKAEGDLARTIEAPANQMRVMGEQITQLSRNIGNVFLPIIAQVLPYLNGVLIVLNRIISALAKLVGYREDAWDNYSEKTSGLADAFDDLGASVGGVGSEAEKTNKKLMGLRGFDKLNVIKTPTKSSSSGGAGGTSINPKLLDAFNKLYANYNSMLDGVETKATQIANAIMKALGQIDFTNIINAGKRLWEAFKPFAENVGQGLLWTFKNVLVPIGKWTIEDVIPTFLDMLADAITILNNAIEGFKPFGEWLWKNFLSPLAKWAGGTIVRTLKDLEGVFRKLSKNKLLSTILTGGVVFATLAKNIGKITVALGKTKLGGAIANLLTPMKSLYDNTKVYANLAKKGGGTLIEAIEAGNDAWRRQHGIINEVTGKVNGLNGVMNGAKVAITNVAIAAVGLEGLKTSLKDAAEEGWNFGNALGSAVSAFSTISGAITAGAVFGPMGAVIGGLAGTIAVISSAFDTLNGKVKDGDEKVAAYTDSWNRLDEATRNHLETDLAVHDNNEKLVQELDDLVDSNGKVKEADEGRVKFILNQLNEAYGTEYQLIDGAITKNGEEIDSIDLVIDEYKKQIKWMKLKAVAAAYEEDYKEMLKKTKKAAKEVEDAEKTRAEKQAAYDEALQNYNKNRSEENLKKLMWADIEMKKADEQYKQASGNYDKLKQDIKNYEDFQSAILEENYDKALELGGNFYDNSEDLFKNNQEKTEKYVNDTIENIKKTIKNLPDGKTVKIKVDADTSTFSSKVANAFKNIKIGGVSLSNIFGKANGGIYSGGQWHDIAQYGTGGLPNQGQLFVAREAGPELVGKIGSNTAVMNNNQIVSSVASGVYNAVKSAMNSTSGGVYNIYLDENHKLGTYTLEQLKGMAKSNGKPIRIGG